MVGLSVCPSVCVCLLVTFVNSDGCKNEMLFQRLIRANHLLGGVKDRRSDESIRRRAGHIVSTISGVYGVCIIIIKNIKK